MAIFLPKPGRMASPSPSACIQCLQPKISIANNIISTPKPRMRRAVPATRTKSWRRPSHDQPRAQISRTRTDQVVLDAAAAAAVEKGGNSDEPSLPGEDRRHEGVAAVGEEPLKIAIVGFGNFGQFIAKGIQRQGHHVLATSRSDYSDYCHQHGIRFFKGVSEMCEEDPDVVLLCSSILSTESVVRAIPTHKLSPDTVFADVLSVKQFPRNLFLQVLPAEFGVVCTHPMFGPESGKHGWAKLPFVYDKVRVANSAQARKCDQFLRIFQQEGCRMVEMSSEEHDRHAAGSQFITHTIGRILSHLDLESTPINTKGYETLLQLTENTVSDSFDLYYGLFMYNVNATEQIENLDRAFETVKQKLFGRLHDILRKQIVGREQQGESSTGRTRRTSSTPLFVPTNGMIKDLPSFGDPPPPATSPSSSSQGELPPRRAEREEAATIL